MSHDRILDLRTQIERAAAEATVADWACDAIWAAPTESGAILRASLCLQAGHTPAEVTDALDRFSHSVTA